MKDFQFDTFGQDEGAAMGKALHGVTDVVIGRKRWGHAGARVRGRHRRRPSTPDSSQLGWGTLKRSRLGRHDAR